MKRFSKISLLSLMIFSLFCVGINKVFAYDKALENNNIPTGYYNDVNLKLSGEEFRENLSIVISKDYVQYPYSSSSSTDIHDILVESDADPSGNGNVICIYTGQSMQPSQTGTIAWDKEHVWAKSHGFPEGSYSKTEPYSDAHNLRPCYASVNRSRSNKDFGVVDEPTREDFGCKQNDVLFEPRDEVKGDVARILFYMATRYGFDKFHLSLTNDTTTSASDLNGVFGNLDTLLKWHYADPVSTSEIYRNNVVYKYQKNRNPYIDHPEYVDLAYPNEYSQESIDQDAVDSVISSIDSLIDVAVTDKDVVNSINESYESLNNSEKKLVSNYYKLYEALCKIEILEGTPKYSYKFTNNAFSESGQTLQLNNVDWTLELKGEGNISNFDSNKGAHFGTNSNPYESVTLTSSAFYNVYRVVVNASGNSYVNANLSCSVGSAQSSSVSISSTATNYEFDFNKASGDINIKLTNNSSKGLYILSITVFYKELSPADSFVLEQTKGSLKLNYDSNLDPYNVCLRFGGRINASSYNPDAKYGLIILNKDKGGILSSGIKSFSSADSFIGDSSYILECNPVRVNENGVEDDNGKYYQFAWVITNVTGYFDTELVGVMYMEYAGMLYLSNSVTHSVETVAKAYVENNIITDSDLVVVLKKLYN